MTGISSQPLSPLAELEQRVSELEEKSPRYVSVLPSEPVDGEEINYQNAAMETLGVVWRFRYRAASASSLKWEFVGGPPMYTARLGSMSREVGGIAELTSGPKLIVPLTGNYIISLWLRGQLQVEGLTELLGFLAEGTTKLTQAIYSETWRGSFEGAATESAESNVGLVAGKSINVGIELVSPHLCQIGPAEIRLLPIRV